MSTTGDGTLTIAVVALAASGEVTALGSGTLTVAVVALAGTGEVTYTGSGSLQVGRVRIRGTGTMAPAGVTGSGAVSIGSVALEGQGVRTDMQSDYSNIASVRAQVILVNGRVQMYGGRPDGDS